MKKFLATVLLIGALVLSSLGSTAFAQFTACTNEPPGLTPVFQTDFNSLAGISDVYSSTAIVSDPTAPVSPNNVARHRMEAGAPTGGGQTHVTATSSREFYVCLWWRVNAQWQGRVSQDKLFFIRNINAPVDQRSNGFFGFKGGPTKSHDGPMYMFWAHNSSNVDNSHICGGPPGLGSGGNCNPNVGSGQVSAIGQWSKIEAYVKTSTTLTSRDGVVKWWVNGNPAGDYSQVNFGGAIGSDEWVWTETWDGCGTGGAPGCDIGPTGVNTNVWEHFIDRLYVSTSTGGGGTTPPPPPPPPPGTLTPPASITMTTVGTAATITWPPVSGVTQYALRVHKGGTSYDPCSSMIRCVIQGSTSFTFTAEYGATYDFWVHSVDSTGSSLSPSVAGNSFTMPPEPNTPPPPPPPPPPPAELLPPTAISMSVEGTSATVSWPAVQGVSNYAIRVWKNGESETCGLMLICQTQPGLSVSLTVEYETAYNYRVYSVGGDGGFSETFREGSFTTPPEPSTPPPTGLLFETTVQWPASTLPDIDGYKIYRSVPCEAPAVYLKSVGVITHTTDTLPVGTSSVGYQVSAFDTADREGSKTKKVCSRFKTPSTAPNGLSVTPR